MRVSRVKGVSPSKLIKLREAMGVEAATENNEALQTQLDAANQKIDELTEKVEARDAKDDKDAKDEQP